MSVKIKEIMTKIDENKILLPNIQRNFIWKREKILDLCDSLIRNYPIGFFLFWATNDRLASRVVIRNVGSGSDELSQVGITPESSYWYILDGQQRLTSLNIAFRGSHSGTKVYLNLFWRDSQEENPFVFLESNSDPKYVLLSRLISDEFNTRNKRIRFAERVCETLEISQSEIILRRRGQVKDEIDDIRYLYSELNVNYFLIDSIQEEISGNDIIEIFARLNMKGTKLTKADLIYSMIKYHWEDAEREFKELKSRINRRGFKFTDDFIIKMCMVTLGEGAAFKVEKIQDPSKINQISVNWPMLKDSFLAVTDFLVTAAKASEKVVKSYNVMIPILYYIFLREDRRIPDTEVETVVRWFYISLLNSRIFSTDSNIDAINQMIKNHNLQTFPMNQIIHDMRKERGKVITFEKSHLNIKSNYLIFFNLLTLIRQNQGIDFDPVYQRNKPQIDHIFPRSKLRTLGLPDRETNRIGNLCIRTRHHNLIKSNQDPNQYFPDQPSQLLEQHTIPLDRTLWEYPQYRVFVQAREDLFFEVLQEYFDMGEEILISRASNEDVPTGSARAPFTFFPHEQALIKGLTKTDITNTLIIIPKDAWGMFPDESTPITIQYHRDVISTRLRAAPTSSSVVRRFRDGAIARWFRENNNLIAVGVRIKLSKMGANRYNLEILPEETLPEF